MESILNRSFERRQLGGVMHGAVPVVVESKMQPLLILADESVGIVQGLGGPSHESLTSTRW